MGEVTTFVNLFCSCEIRSAFWNGCAGLFYSKTCTYRVLLKTDKRDVIGYVGSGF